jgi:biotin carboxyl carrier protein
MPKMFKISVDGRSYDVVVEEVADGGYGRAAPQPHPAPPAAPMVVAPAPSAAAVAPPRSPPPAAAAPISAGAELAPLGGVVESVDVTVGQAIKAGDKILTIEAMKMKTEIFAKHTGTVANISVRQSDSVETGQVLLTIG